MWGEISDVGRPCCTVPLMLGNVDARWAGYLGSESFSEGLAAGAQVTKYISDCCSSVTVL